MPFIVHGKPSVVRGGNKERHAPSCHESPLHSGQRRSSNTTFHTAAKQHLRAMPGGWAVAPGPRQLQEEAETALKRGSGPSPGQGPMIKGPPRSNHSSLQKQEEGARHPSWGPQPSPEMHTCTRTHYTHPHTHKHNDQLMGAAGRKTAGPGPSSLKDQRLATALTSQGRLCALS